MQRFRRCDDAYENPVSVSTYSSTCFNLLVSRTREASEITSRRRRANIGSYSSRLYGAYVPTGFPLAIAQLWDIYTHKHIKIANKIKGVTHRA